MKYFIAVWFTYISHELFDFEYWYCKVVEVFDGVFMDGSLDPGIYSNLIFHLFLNNVVTSRLYLCFFINGQLWASIMTSPCTLDHSKYAVVVASHDIFSRPT